MSRRWAALAAGGALLLALHAVLRWPVHDYLLSDTTGYLANARWLAGKAGDTWQGPSSFYHPAWSVLVAPIWALLDSPRSVQVGALTLNALLAAAVLPTAYAVGRRAFDLPARVALAGAAVAATYPAVLLLAGYEWGESLYQLLFLLFVLAAAAVLARPGIAPAAAVGFLGAALNATHPRGLGVVAVTGVFLLVLAYRRLLPRPAAAAGLAALVAVFLATRLVSAALLDAIYSDVSAGVEGDVLARLTDPALLWGAVKATIGQLWYLTVATLGLAPIGVLWLATSRRLPTGLRLVTLAAALATLAASAVEMSDGTRVDHMVYGRYIEGLVPLLLVAGAAGVAAWRSQLPKLLAGVAALATVLGGLVVLLRGGDLLSGNVMPLNVTGVLVYRDQVSEIDVARVTVLALAVTTVVLLVATRRALVGLGLAAALFAGSAVSVQARTLDPFDDYWGGVTEISEVVRLVSDDGPVSYDRGGYIPEAANFYQLELADRGVRFTEGRPGTDLVIASPTWPGAARYDARLVFVEVGPYDQALWVLPGALQDELARNGPLLPEQFSEPLPAPARVQRVDADVPGTLDAGEERIVDVDVTHAGRRLGWLAKDAVPGVVHGTVRVGARWYDGAGEVLGQTGELGRVLLPGESVTTELRLVAPERPGRYRLTIGLRQEGVVWFDDPRSFTVVVR